jgi:Plasmid pRiA4b ORF-3-like protein
LKQPEIPVEVYVVKVTLLGTSPPVWRRILVPRDITLQHLHWTLQTVMGWTNSHLHQFVVQRQRISDPRSRVGTKVANENRTRLGELIWMVGTRLLYEYGTAGSTSLFLKKFCLETKRFSRHAWQVNDVVRRKTVEGRKDLESFSKHSRTPITRVTMRPVSGLAILSLNPSLQMKLTDDYAAGNTNATRARSMSAIACGC